MKKLSNTEAELKKALLIKKACNPKTEKHLVLQKFVEEESSNVYKLENKQLTHPYVLLFNWPSFTNVQSLNR